MAALIKKYDNLLTMPQNIFTLITAQYGISDNYASQAKKINMKINEFSKLCKRVKGEDKDNFNLGYFKRFDKK